MRDGFSDWNMPRNTEHFQVIPETVCEFTGLTDKNGKRIFEGGRVRFNGFNLDNTIYDEGVVCWQEFKWIVKGKTKVGEFGIDLNRCRNFEVIGDIFNTRSVE